MLHLHFFKYIFSIVQRTSRVQVVRILGNYTTSIYIVHTIYCGGGGIGGSGTPQCSPHFSHYNLQGWGGGGTSLKYVFYVRVERARKTWVHIRCGGDGGVQRKRPYAKDSSPSQIFD